LHLKTGYRKQKDFAAPNGRGFAQDGHSYSVAGLAGTAKLVLI
jgi:hypothetical protein